MANVVQTYGQGRLTASQARTGLGPENHGRRTQFMERLVEFAIQKEVNLSLIYYPPYHSKYNPIERVWGVHENHWKGKLLDSVEKTLGLARTITNSDTPVVKFVNDTHEKGVKLSQKAMRQIENMIGRLPGIETWAVNILFYWTAAFGGFFSQP